MWPLVIVIIILLLILLKNKFYYWEYKNVPHRKSHFLFGALENVILLRKTIGMELRDLYNEYSDKKYFGIWAFHQPILVVRDLELIKRILIKDFRHFNDHFVACDERSDAIASNMLLMAKNPMWKYLRQTTSPIFTKSKLRSMFDRTDTAGKDLLKYIDKEYLNRLVDHPKHLCHLYVLQSLINSIFSMDAKIFDEPDSEFLKCSIEFKAFKEDKWLAISSFCYFLFPIFVTIFKMKLFKSSIYKFMRSMVWNNIKERETNSDLNKIDLIHIMMQMMNDRRTSNYRLDGDRVVAQAVQLFAAGIETSTETLSYAMYELAINKDIQRRLRDEIKDVIPTIDDLNFENVGKIKYLNYVIYETLRKYPILPFLDRICVEDYKMPDGSGLIIEKGTPVFISTLGIHYDSNYHENPDVFNPDRFDDFMIRNNYEQLPFGNGARSCIGKRFAIVVLQTGLINLLSNYDIVTTAETPSSIKFETKGFLLQAASPLNLKFNRIN